MEKVSWVRVVVSATGCEPLMTFMASRPVDLGGRPHRSGDVWRVELYLPATEAKGLAAEGCTFDVDETYFERLQKAQEEEEARRPSHDELRAILARGGFPGVYAENPGKRGGRP